MKLKISKTKQEVALNFSRYLAILIANREKVHIALSGGSTPKIVFDELATNFQEDIDWSNVHLYWGDERCVEPTDEQSNYKMTLEHLLSKIHIPKENIHRIKGENDPDFEAKRYADVLEKQLPKSENLPQFDLVILGMGDDGHTASIFPHEIELWNSERYCEVAIHPDSGQKRVTITGQILNNADTVAFLVTGASKAEKFTEIKNRTGNFKSYPVSLVNPSSERLIWFLDEAAAGFTSNQF
ncbi:MAG: 6-phosphogluconolactonase [Maribacter sp.]